MHFMYSSIEKLVQNFSYADLKYLFEKSSPEQLELVKREGMYPYEYVDSFERFYETKPPDQSKFYDFLKNKRIDIKDYMNAIKIWKNLKKKNFGKYHCNYLKRDVLSLAEMF